MGIGSEDPKLGPKFGWFLLYSFLCGIEFCIEKAKGWVKDRLFPKDKPPPEDD